MKSAIGAPRMRGRKLFGCSAPRQATHARSLREIEIERVDRGVSSTGSFLRSAAMRSERTISSVNRAGGVVAPSGTRMTRRCTPGNDARSTVTTSAFTASIACS